MGEKRERDSPKRAGRDNKGRFVKGHADNGAGRKKQSPEFRALLTTNAPKALETVIQIMNDKSASNRDRITAASIVLDRAYGKAVANVQFDQKADMMDDIRTEMEKIKRKAALDPETAGALDDIRVEMNRLRNG